MINRTKYKLGVLAIKYIPIVCALFMWINLFISLFDCRWNIVEALCGITLFPAIILLLMTEIFNFCWIHKAFTIYTIISDTLINIERFIGLGELYIPLKSLMLSIGIVLFVVLLLRIKEYHYKCCKYE